MMKKVMGATALLLLCLSPAWGAVEGECDMTALGKADQHSGRELPSVAARDAVFACAGVERYLPDFDQLEKDLLFMTPTYLDFATYRERYQGIPGKRLKKLWSMVLEFKEAQGLRRNEPLR